MLEKQNSEQIRILKNSHTAPKYLENIVKIFPRNIIKLPKYCINLALSAQNMTYAIFSKYYKNEQIHKQCFFKINYTKN